MHRRPNSQDQDDILGGLDSSYRQISEGQLNEFCRLYSTDKDAAADVLATMLRLENHKQNTRDHLRVTFTALALSVAKDRHFAPVKAGVVFNIAQTLLAAVVRSDSREECQAGESWNSDALLSLS
jgi:hypothetical protein